MAGMVKMAILPLANRYLVVKQGFISGKKASGEAS
jgi:hypothetical protein